MTDEQSSPSFREVLRELANAPPIENAPGTWSKKTIGRYEVKKVLGRGGFGVVYLAWDPDTKRNVAIKLAWRRSPEGTEDAFKREIQTNANLRHDNIVILHDCGEDSGQHYVVFEYLEGQTLRQRLAAGPIVWREALRIAMAVAKALAFAHDRGVVHRDVNPNNIFLLEDEQRTVKLIDFGLAHSIENARSAPNAGTRGFTAPEGARNKCSDVFSAGMTFYWCLSGGTLPFATRLGQNNPEQLETVPATPTRSAVEDLHAPRAIKRAILRATHLIADQRPADGRAWLNALQRVKWLAMLPKASHVVYGTATLSIVLLLAGATRLSGQLFSAAQRTLRTAMHDELRVVGRAREQPTRAGSPRISTGVVDLDGKVTASSPVYAPYFVDMIDDVELVMVRIPGGAFEMGTPSSESSPGSKEAPVHPVRIKPFYLARFEVTEAQWAKIAALEATDSKDLLPVNPVPDGSPNAPVRMVSWLAAKRFCELLSERTKRHYRLPTEAEWEYAARAHTQTAFAFGPNITQGLAVYNCRQPYQPAQPKGQPLHLAIKCDPGEIRDQPREVGSREFANAFGLFDMHGNVWEWCQDVYGPYPVSKKPSDGAAPDGKDQEPRVIRGGAWTQPGDHIRSGYRFYAKPNEPFVDIGFRVAADL